MNFTIPADHRMKIKEIKKKEKKKRDEYLDLVRELKKLWNMMVTVILLLPKDTFSTCPWEQTLCLLCELGIEFSVHLFSGSF